MHTDMNAELARSRELELRIIARRPNRLMARELVRPRPRVRSRRTR